MTEAIAEKVREFFAQYPEKVFEKGQIIVHAGEAPAGVFYMVEGRISQYDITTNGNEVVVNVFKPPAFLPMSWAINRDQNQYFFAASTRVVARLAPPDDVVAFLRREPDVLYNLLARVYRGTEGLLRRTAHIMGGDARSRLVYEIITAAYRFGKKDEREMWHVPLKEGELAQHSGLARETANRVIRDLKAAGLVEVSPSGLSVPDIVRLQDQLGRDL